MNLTLKVLLSLTIVLAVALITTALLVERWAGDAYRGYVATARQGQMDQLAIQSALLFEQTRDWAVVQEWLDSLSSSPSGMPVAQGRGRMRGSNSGGPWRNAAYVLLDPSDGTPLVANAHDGQVAMSAITPVVVNGSEVARLALVGQSNGFGPSEQALLDQVRRAITLSALVSAVVALALGGALMANILQPLKKIESGVAAVARGDLSARVEGSTRRDELGNLAANFNAMAASLQEQEALRRRLVSDLAHELRTPLSVVQGNLQALLDGVYPLTRDELQAVFNETELLVRLVHDLHELAQAEAGRLPLSVQRIHVSDVLQAVANAFRQVAEKRSVAIGIQPLLPGLDVLADPDRLQQILHNLIGNALRHTPEGGAVTLAASAQTDSVVRITVRDSGPGIDPRDLPYIFDRFYQSGNRAARLDSYTAGAGLGLAIVKALAEAHGGAAGVESKSGEGALFWIDLPRAP